MRCANRAEQWSSFDPSKMPFGVVDVAAIDAKWSVLDRFRFIHLPNATRVSVKIPKSDGGVCTVTIQGLGTEQVIHINHSEVKISASDVSPTSAEFEVITDASRNEKLQLRARWPNNEALLSVPVPVKSIAFYDADGHVIPDNASLSFADLRGASVEAIERSTVSISARENGRSDKTLTIQRDFDRALPFSQIRDDIERLFAATDELDIEVRVEALQAGTARSVLRIFRFDIDLERNDEGEVMLTRRSMQRLQQKPGHDLWCYGRPFMDTDGAERKLEMHLREIGEAMDRSRWRGTMVRLCQSRWRNAVPSV